jgi:hypothetical protein
LICVFACLVPLVVTTSASAAYSHGTPEQIAWVRSAATRFVSAELAGDGAGACAVLEGRLRFTRGGRTCAQRWDAKLHALLRVPSARGGLHALKRAIPSAAVAVPGKLAWIHLRAALMNGPNRFRWTENCWMLQA